MKTNLLDGLVAEKVMGLRPSLDRPWHFAIGSRPAPCPDGMDGCLVVHWETRWGQAPKYASDPGACAQVKRRLRKAGIEFSIERWLDSCRVVGGRKGNFTLEPALVRCGVAKVASYAAQVARAQALGVDPNLLLIDGNEFAEAMAKIVALANAAGKPVFIARGED